MVRRAGHGKQPSSGELGAGPLLGLAAVERIGTKIAPSNGARHRLVGWCPALASPDLGAGLDDTGEPPRSEPRPADVALRQGLEHLGREGPRRARERAPGGTIRGR
jgi:hypothetical protein